MSVFAPNGRGRFSLNLSGECAYPAGAQEGRHLRFPPSCESPLSLGGHGGDGGTETIEERQRIFSTVGEHSVLPFLYLFAVSDTVLLHIRLSPRRGRHDSAAQFFCALYRPAPAKINCTECLIRRCRALQHAKVLRDTVMSRLRRVTRLCSSMLSVNCEKVERATQR